MTLLSSLSTHGVSFFHFLTLYGIIQNNLRNKFVYDPPHGRI